MPTRTDPPATVRTTVSAAALAKVGRLFNGTARDALVELLQNARRAGAGRVSVDIVAEAEGARLVVRDDGIGVADPALLFALGASGWDDAILAREDPAGMGVFSLAGRAVTIRSRPHGAPGGWHVAIGPADWEAGAPLAVAPDPIERGTELSIAFPPGWDKDFPAVAAEVARYYPLPVLLAGGELAREPWLDGAVAIETVSGVRIGVFREGSPWTRLPRINFHGVAVPCALPTLAEVGEHRQWTVKVDIVDAPRLQLVLPARKEMVENAALAELREACEAALYRAVAARPAHRLAHADWRRAAALGVALPEAAPRLPSWTPERAGADAYPEQRGTTSDAGMILVDGFDPDLAQSAARALGDGGALGGRLVDAEARFQGYGWYDALPRIVALEFAITAAGRTSRYGRDGDLDPDLSTGRVERLTLDVTFADGEHVTVPADLLVTDPGRSGLDDATVLVTRDAGVALSDLVDLLEAVCFSPSDDREADSWETQRERFLLDARQLAIALLLSRDEALLDRIAREIAISVRWLVPAGRRLAVEVAGDEIAARFAGPAAA